MAQTALADAGPSTIHVDRSLQGSRNGGLVDLRDRRPTVPDHAGLMDLAMFDPTCLHRWMG